MRDGPWPCECCAFGALEDQPFPVFGAVAQLGEPLLCKQGASSRSGFARQDGEGVLRREGSSASRARARFDRGPSWLYGAVAQLGEHLLCKQGVSGSIPLSSTKSRRRRRRRRRRGRQGRRPTPRAAMVAQQSACGSVQEKALWFRRRRRRRGRQGRQADAGSGNGCAARRCIIICGRVWFCGAFASPVRRDIVKRRFVRSASGISFGVFLVRCRAGTLISRRMMIGLLAAATGEISRSWSFCVIGRLRVCPAMVIGNENDQVS